MRDKINQIYDFTKENLYLCLPDIEVDGKKYNSTLLFEMLTSLVNGKHLIKGEYGLGKTTSAESIISLMHSLPKEVVLASEIRGHAEQTEEKILARPDLGELNLGREKVLWSYFVLNTPKIIDELNRFPPSKLNMFVDGIDRGNWQYMSDMVKTKDFALFATCNWADLSNGAISEVILERFGIASESRQPHLTQIAEISDMDNGASAELEDLVVSNKIFEIYNAKDMSYLEKLKRVDEITSQFKSELESRLSIPLITPDEKKSIYSKIKDMELSEEAELFFLFATSELSTCQWRNGEKRKNDKCFASQCHYKDHACSKTANALSMRTVKNWKKYARALAWFTGSDEVTVEHMAKVFPYVTWHKTVYDSKFMSSLEKDKQGLILPLYAATRLINEIQQRFSEQAPFLKNYVALRRDAEELEEAGKSAEAKAKLEEASKYASDKDHMVFKEQERTDKI
ncbi:AAA family ATPase [Candidatus Woesearchaeota archaeon]|nr:AAA family ATPase [Candidatus Woesearchaeota archaeon]